MKKEKAEEVEKKSAAIMQWIETILDEKLPKPTLRESLLDGVVLCKLINALQPGALKRYHKKPRMLAMKIENIGFFLATCKTRMNLPQELLFQPTDIHDDQNNLASMSKVLNVLSYLKGEDQSEMIEELPDDEEEGDAAAAPANTEQVHEHESEPEPPEPEIPEPVSAPAPTPAAIPTKVSAPAVKPTPTPAAAPVATPAPVATSTPVPAQVSAPTSSLPTESGEEVQSQILKIVLDAVNSELSVQSKMKLVRILEHQIQEFNQKVMFANEDKLASLAKTFNCSEELASAKGRENAVDILLKHARIQ